MSNLIVIGGPSRVGKTTLARKLKRDARFAPYSVFDLDAYKATLSDTCGVGEADLATPDEILGAHSTDAERDELVFGYAKPYLRRVLDRGWDVIAEGRFRPSFDLSDLSRHNVVEVCLVRTITDVDAEARMLAGIEASDPDGGWLERSGWELRQFAEHHITSVERFKAEAQAHGKRCFDAHADEYGGEGGFEKLLEDAQAYIESGLPR